MKNICTDGRGKKGREEEREAASVARARTEMLNLRKSERRRAGSGVGGVGRPPLCGTNNISLKKLPLPFSTLAISHPHVSTMPESNAMAKKRIQKANREAGIGDKDGRLTREKDKAPMLKCTVCSKEITATKTNTEAAAHAENKHSGKTTEECFPGAAQAAADLKAKYDLFISLIQCLIFHVHMYRSALYALYVCVCVCLHIRAKRKHVHNTHARMVALLFVSLQGRRKEEKGRPR
jgi:hypothetical protein